MATLERSNTAHPELGPTSFRPFLTFTDRPYLLEGDGRARKRLRSRRTLLTPWGTADRFHRARVRLAAPR